MWEEHFCGILEGSATGAGEQRALPGKHAAAQQPGRADCEPEAFTSQGAEPRLVSENALEDKSYA